MVTEEELRKFQVLTPREKLEWLEEANTFIDKFLPERSRRLHEKFRRGEK